ncbi:MAG TPA: circularly permuted type 2 ATP-grasp protein [Rhizomicrobium sp.]|nr:circularly permuted type 2 ATP-grasp protein [Rhizomicrobium sp.]
MSEVAEPPSATLPARFDELRDAAGELRPHWRAFARTLASLSPEEFERRQASARATVQDNGVTYNVYDDRGGQARPWQLDIVPFILSAGDWKQIEAAVIQRAMLADMILRDVYGPQALIRESVLPPHLVTGHPQFLRPLCGARPAQNVHVHLYSADLARGADGSWRVMASRADAPGGLGYALENRLVVAQTFPESFGDMQVARLAAFFNAYRESILGLGASRRDRAVLLTPGPYNEAYFEHVYLAHYLGLTLVQGDDLAVRDGEVFLKTLTGLERVAAIFRRVDSDFCDPLEFRGDSALGVPGLTEAVRAGSVVLANALGGGVIESPAMDAYLPNICRVLLGEELRIPDISTIWCGTEWGRKEALARMDHSILRDAFDARPLFSRRSSARLGADLDEEERERLVARLNRRGETMVLQEISPLGLAPVFEKGEFGAKPVSLRVFATWTPNGWVVMPGGLTRVAANETVRALSMQSGASSKDAWVLSTTPVDNFSLLANGGRTLEIRRHGESAPSRAMDNLFWLGRYAERTESFVRILRSVAARVSDEPAAALEVARKLLIPFSQASDAPIEEIADEHELAEELNVLIYSPRHSRGLQRLLTRVEQMAWSVRDRLSLDTWRTIHAMTGQMLPPVGVPFEAAGARFYLDALVRRTAALSGLSAENMTRGPNWLFMELGRRVERAQHLAWLVRQTVGHADVRETEHMRILLEIADSAMTYRSRYLNVFQLVPFVDLLLLDENNPRSCAFQLATIESHLRELPRITQAQLNDVPGTIAHEMRGATANAHPARLAFCAAGVRPGLVELTDTITSSAAELSDAIADAYFQHASRSRTGSGPMVDA